MTTSGLFGTVTAVDGDRVELEIADGVGVRFVAAAIASVVEQPTSAGPTEDQVLDGRRQRRARPGSGTTASSSILLTHDLDAFGRHGECSGRAVLARTDIDGPGRHGRSRARVRARGIPHATTSPRDAQETRRWQHRPRSTRTPQRTLASRIRGVLLGIWTFWPGQSHVPKSASTCAGGTQVILTPTANQGGQVVTDDQLKQAVEIIRQRVDGFGVAESEVTTQGSGQNASIIVSIPGVTDSAVLNTLATTAKLDFRPVLLEAVGGHAHGDPDPVGVEQRLEHDVALRVSVRLRVVHDLPVVVRGSRLSVGIVEAITVR